MSRVRRAGLAACAIAWARAAPAWADPPTVPPTYGLSWVRAEGAEACPSARVLIGEVERRLGRRVFDMASDRTFEVEVTRLGATYRSDVFARDAEGRTLGHRTLQSDEPGCSSLLNATALAIALVIDPNAAAREPAPPSHVPSFEGPPLAAPTSAAPTPVAPTPVAVAPAPAPTAAAVAPRRSPIPVTVGRRFDSAQVSVRGELSAGLLPAASPGVELAFNVHSRARWGFALSGAYANPQNSSVGVGALSVGLTRAALLATFQAVRSSSLRLQVLAGPTLGAFHVAVRQPAPVTDPGDYWFAAAQLAAELQLFVTPGLFVEAGGSAFLPLIRQEFAVRGQAQPVWAQGWLSGVLFFGVGTMFP